MPKVSVILTVYNKPQWLKECIDSVIAQTYSDWELIILEDNSPLPEVREIIESYLPNSQIKVYYSGITEGERYKTTRYATLINYGISNFSTGEYITYLTDDDFYYSHRLGKMVECISADGVSIVYGSQQIVDADGNHAGVRYVDGVLDNAWNKVDHNSVMHKKELFNEVGGWSDTPDIWGGADAHFWRKLTDAGYRFYPVGDANDPPLEAKRYHQGSVQWLVHNGLFFPS
jgi:spore maturation protein CgeD